MDNINESSTTRLPSKNNLGLVIIIIIIISKNSLVVSKIMRGINENIGKGAEYNNNLIDDPKVAALTKPAAATRLSYLQLRCYFCSFWLFGD